MGDGMQTDAAEIRRQKARQLRYKKPIVRYLNLETIQNELWEIESRCDDVRWFADADDDTLINALDGDEDEAYEFRMMYADLCAECEMMAVALDEEWIPDCFDKFFVAAGAGADYGGLLGYDSFEGDYLGINGADRFAEDAAKKSLKQLTKDELIAAARQCFKVFQSYIGLRYRYDCLEAAIEILRGENTGYLQMVTQINEMYERAESESCGFKYLRCDAVRDLDRLLDALPPEAWVQ